MTEPRPYRPPLGRDEAARRLGQDAADGRLDGNAVGAVIEAAGQPAPPVARPAGLTEREAEVLRLLAQGRQTKQIGRALGISSKTADRHIQNIYGKIGVSTRPAATLFAVNCGLLAWGELPMGNSSDVRSVERVDGVKRLGDEESTDGGRPRWAQTHSSRNGS